MKRIAIISDLHCDHWIKHRNMNGIPNIRRTFVNNILDRIRKEHSPDKIIIAGDFWNGAADETLDFGDDVFIVMGNHDYYHEDFPVEPRINRHVHGDTSILGLTLWTNFWEDVSGMAWHIYKGISDSRYIKDTTTNKVIERFGEEWMMIMEENPEIVVTHFPPTIKSISEEFIGDYHNSYFCNDKEEELFDNQGNIKLWVCGHVHHKHVYNVGDILVVCNPLGYPGENYVNEGNYKPVIVEKDETGKWIIDGK